MSKSNEMDGNERRPSRQGSYSKFLVLVFVVPIVILVLIEALRGQS